MKEEGSMVLANGLASLNADQTRSVHTSNPAGNRLSIGIGYGNLVSLMENADSMIVIR